MSIEWNEDALAQLQADANAKVRDVAREVNAEMAGQPVDAVYDELWRRLEVAGFVPTADGVRETAEAISEGTLTE